MQKNHRTLILSDIHVPDHDEKALKCALDFGKKNKVDEIVLAGDILDFESVSKHGGNPSPPKLKQELDEGKKFFSRLRKIFPTQKIVFIEGNHEHRLTRFLSNDASPLYGAMLLPDLLDLKKYKIQHMRYGAVYQRGKMHITHGHLCGVNHAQAMLKKYGVNIVYGHTHRPQMMTSSNYASPILGAWGLGCLCKLDAGYLNGAPSGWAHGFGYLVTDKKSGVFTMHNMIIVDGKIYS